MNNTTFAGNKKVGKNILTHLDKYLVQHFTHRIPSYIETYHLTMLTLVWSGLIIIFSYYAQYNIHWLWICSMMILLQYLTDLFDGAVGRQRNTGLIKWGYYMDHYLDYVFLCSLLIGYGFIVPENFSYMFFFILAVFGAFMVNSYLSFAATNQFRISYFGIGPTEIRFVFIIINTLIIVFGKTYLAQALPFALTIAWVGLNIVVFKTQKELWIMDMKHKEKQN
ncbi:MAG: CDP-alcohol phosphatidyltransferase family protein [Candidatus Kerfeldbacteria bacterium]|nr:CDP-alcohol phosphatidyltransferase family protein [Candidatus Kerfeldbacteria bacterium]